MIVLNGKGVYGGIAIGRISFYQRNRQQVAKYAVSDVQGEQKRFEEAKALAISQLQGLYDKALGDVGEANAMIFQIHQMMLQDQDYCESVAGIIRDQKINAEYAVSSTSDTFAGMFAAMDDAYMKERAADVKDVSQRVIDILSHSQKGSGVYDEPVIVAADDLVPSETVQLDKEKVLAFVTQRGSVNSHTAILARTMNIPAVIDVGDGLKPEYDGMEAIVDGFSGQVYIQPDTLTSDLLLAKKAKDEKRRRLLQQLKGQENVTLDGQKIHIYANIGGTGDVNAALQNDAGGIGLFRSEFLYLESKNYPTEEEQFVAYQSVAQAMKGKKVIIRTLDIGADKQIDYFNLDTEDNPAMGYRAIRICLDRPDVFKTQLRALFRASAFGNIAIMFPMITAVEEIQEIKAIVEEVKAGLRQEEIPFEEKTELGIMIETPAAAVISDLLAKEVDFFSIGTNDLTQYTLAVDRQNPKLDDFYRPHHTALLRLIELVVRNAHKAGIWAGICGELGADVELIPQFLAMGLDEVSVAPPCVLEVRQKVRETDVSKVERPVWLDRE